MTIVVGYVGVVVSDMMFGLLLCLVLCDPKGFREEGKVAEKRKRSKGFFRKGAVFKSNLGKSV